jgi:hypothetical protein
MLAGNLYDDSEELDGLLCVTKRKLYMLVCTDIESQEWSKVQMNLGDLEIIADTLWFNYLGNLSDTIAMRPGSASGTFEINLEGDWHGPWTPVKLSGQNADWDALMVRRKWAICGLYVSCLAIVGIVMFLILF